MDATAAHWQRQYEQRISRNETANFMRVLGYHPPPGVSERELYLRLLEHLRAGLQLAPTNALLDIANGLGIFTRALAGEVRFAVGTDLTKGLINKGRQIGQQLELPALGGVLQANADAQPFRDQSFDRILCFGVFFYLSPSSAGQTVGEIVRLLKPGGRALIGDILHPQRIHFERSYISSVPRCLYGGVLRLLRAKTRMGQWRGRAIYHAYDPIFFKKLLPSHTLLEIREGERDGRRNNAARYDLIIEVPK